MWEGVLIIGKSCVCLRFVVLRAGAVSGVGDLFDAGAFPAACGRLYKEPQGDLTTDR